MVSLPPIPAKRYFTISEVALLCEVKPHVLRYWEQEFVQLRPMKRRGNRRYYQHHELLMVRRIRSLLYDEGFTIQGARNRLRSYSNYVGVPELAEATADLSSPDAIALAEVDSGVGEACALPATTSMEQVRRELLQIRSLLAL